MYQIAQFMTNLFGLKSLVFSLFLSCFTNLSAQNEHAFKIYTAKGKSISYKKMQESSSKKELVLFGEFHDNPIAHWLQYELMLSLYDEHRTNLVLGFEMFEQDQQGVVDRYLSGELNEKQFKDSCRLWENYTTDYKPLLDFAKDKKLTCIASNVERKYASLLFKKGRAALDTLSPLIRSQMADNYFNLDTTLSQYIAVREMFPSKGKGMVEAQAFKDATMAKFIMKEMKNNKVVLHFNGAFHSDYFQGILWYIQEEKPAVKALTISTVSQKNINKLDAENLGKADFIICVPESMTKTH
jgi:uncharacterized iron-regulated protein